MAMDTVMVDSLSVLSFNLKGVDIYCETPGEICIDDIAGSPDFEIEWVGPESGDTTIAGTEICLPVNTPGDYVVTITDANMCVGMDTITIDSFDMLPFNTIITDVACEIPGEICVSVTEGTPDYEIKLTGPVSDTITTDSAHCFTDLPAGDYIIMVTDSLVCTGMDTVTIDSFNLEIAVTAISNECSPELGSIDVDILEGTSPYIIEWMGPISGY